MFPSPSGEPHAFGTAARDSGYRPSSDSDSDSSSKDSLLSSLSDRHSLHSLYSDNSTLNADVDDYKSPRRQYFDYSITTPSPPNSPSKYEDEKVQDAVQSYPCIPPTSYPLPWELPLPSITRSAASHKVSVYDDCRTDSPPFFQSQSFWLALYFCFNLGLTLYNKAVLIHFPYAYALTALHALCGSIGGFALLRLGVYVPAKLTKADNMALLAFSSLYTINIAVSNLSLELVTIPVSPVDSFHLSVILKLRPFLVPPGCPSSYPNIHCFPLHIFIRHSQ